MNYLIR